MANKIKVKEKRNANTVAVDEEKIDTGNNIFESEGQLVVDIFEDDKNFVVLSAIAGVQISNLDISVEEDMMIIKGNRQNPHEKNPGKKYFYQECYWGTFSRSIILPVEIDADRAEAKIKNGILTIRIPKANAAVTRKLKVKAT